MYEKTANVFGWGAQLILIFSPENEDSLFWRILAVYWHEKTASENIVFKMIG